MKKFAVTTLILTLALFASSLNSFAKKDNEKGNGAIVFQNETPNTEFIFIQDLVFDFGEEFYLTLPDETAIPIQCVAVVAPGREILVITPSDRYNYDAKLDAGLIFAISPKTAEGSDCSELNPRIESPDEIASLADLALSFESASLSEHYFEEEPGVVPDDVNLFFKVSGANFLDSNGNPIEPAFKLMLKLKNGIPQFIKFKF